MNEKHELKRINHRLRVRLELVRELLEIIMANIDQDLQDVADESTLEDSLITLLGSVQQQLAAALSGATIPADVQTKIDAVFSGLEANKAKLAAALASNTPAAPVTPGATP